MGTREGTPRYLYLCFHCVFFFGKKKLSICLILPHLSGQSTVKSAQCLLLISYPCSDRHLCACLGWVRMWLTSLLPPNPSLVKLKKRKRKTYNISSGVSHSFLASLSLLWLQACVPVPTLTFPNPYHLLLWFFSSHHVVSQDLLFWPKSSPNSLRIWGDCPGGGS